MNESDFQTLTPEETKAWLRKMIPDDVLRLRFYGEDALFILGIGDETARTRALYQDIAIYSGFRKNVSELYQKVRGEMPWRTPQEIAKGLKVYRHSGDFLRWLMDKFLEDDYTEAVVIVQQEIERQGGHIDDVKGRFEL